MMEARPNSILTEIIRVKKLEVANAKQNVPLSELKQQVQKLPSTRPFASCLQQPGKVALIAEIKKRSPSKGLIRNEFDVAAITRSYTRSGAAAISILADQNFFGGDPEYIRKARKNTHLPILFKEFIIDPYQLYQARILGADAVLLIVKILTPSELAYLMALAGELGLEVLTETHNGGEIRQAIKAGAKIVGINNRNLETFQTNIETTFLLRREITDPEITVVSESGISSRRDMEKLARHQVHAALIGEALMRRPDLDSAVRELLGNTGAGEVG